MGQGCNCVHCAVGGRNYTLGTTQFEADGAREAFPCFDEPALKVRCALHASCPQQPCFMPAERIFRFPPILGLPAADGFREVVLPWRAGFTSKLVTRGPGTTHETPWTGQKLDTHGAKAIAVAVQARFNFSLSAPAHLTALFNSRQAGAALALPGGALSRRSFEPTPPMSPYLVAFVVGNLTNASALVPGATPMDEKRVISVWGTPDRCAAAAVSKRKDTCFHTGSRSGSVVLGVVCLC